MPNAFGKLASAKRLRIEFEADAAPGIYLMHSHKVYHAMNGETYPGGIGTGLVSEEATNSDIFASLMDDASFEG